MFGGNVLNLFAVLVCIHVFASFSCAQENVTTTVEATPTTTTSTTTIDPVAELAREAEYRREFVVNIAKEAWDSYERYAWGSDSVKPLTKQPSKLEQGELPGRTILASMSTLWLMGLKSEFERGKEWISTKLNFTSISQEVFVAEIVSEYVGSLLSCYALTSETLFLDKAKEIQLELDRVAFSNQTGLYRHQVIPGNQTNQNRGELLYLNDLGGKHLEYRYLSAISGLEDRSKRSRQYLLSLPLNETDQMYPFLVNTTSNEWYHRRLYSIQEYGEPFYSNLIKQFIQSNGTDVESLQLYLKAIESIERNQLITTSAQGHKYARDFLMNSTQKSGGYEEWMQYKGCNLGAMFALSAHALERRNGTYYESSIERYRQLAEQLTETCHLAANKTATKLPPARFYFTGHEEADNHRLSHRFYYFGSELLESYFILYRLTHKQKYRDYAWELVQAIQQHARITENGAGYAAIADVHIEPTDKIDYQMPELLAATLKYLYLIFAPDELLPLDQWVLNSAAQPLPVCGMNVAYESCDQ